MAPTYNSSVFSPQSTVFSHLLYPHTLIPSYPRLSSFVPRPSSLVLLLFFLLPLSLFAQFDAGINDTINPGIPVTLTATYGLIGEGVAIDDNGVEGPLPIGFSFSFFGNIYTQFYIGANGWISFSPNQNAKGIRNAFAVPNSADYNPKNCILGPFQDLNPLQAGGPFIFYRTIEPDSNKHLVVMWCQTPLYSNACRDSLVTLQIVLNEGSGTIENHLMNKPSCPEWNDNLATMGVQNETGYIGYAVPGRNATSWDAQMEGWMYTPTSADSFQIAQIPYNLQPIVPGEKVVYRWVQGTEQISSQQSVVVTPAETTTYYAYITLCDGQEFMDSVTVFVIPYIPTAFTPNGDGLNDEFRMVGLPPENIAEFHFQIFNRWGEVVFSTRNIEEGWDGTLKGEACPEGLYVWAIYYQEQDRHKVTNKGTVIMIR
ncbi:MAG: gliding motility-associated C-terminal domain-containing protein [Bacteroidales bacterium]|nr:gliding motility-associated C-terminal domain-containing protein [Bacteroidales bacterium]